jgi:cytochrome c oxidase cbb3-type subunit 2
MFRWFDHGKIECNLILMGVLTLITVSIGGLVQIVPLFAVETTNERVEGVRPYTPLELAGRNIYVREGCYTCHSQMDTSKNPVSPPAAVAAVGHWRHAGS